MHDWTTPHTTYMVLDALYEKFGDKVSLRKYQQGKKCVVTWPAHSLDLNPCDFSMGLLEVISVQHKANGYTIAPSKHQGKG